MDKEENPILFDIPVPIETERLILRPPQAGDGAALHEAKMETWEDINRWMPWAKTKSTLDEDEATCREAYAKFIRREDMMMFGFEKGTGRWVIGTGLHRFDWHIRRFEIGYWVRQSAQGKGYATEAANALTRYAFTQLQGRAVMINYAEGNDKSHRVIEKLGFEKEGVIRNGIALPDDSVTHIHVYSVLNIDNLPPLNVSW